MNCINCGALLESSNSVVKCPYCGGLTQTAPVVLSQALRIETINDTATVMIEKWRALPTGCIQIFSTGLDNQQSVSVHILQGDDEKLERNREVGRFTFDGISPAPRGEPQIQFTFEIAEDGILLVTAENQSTGKKVTFPRMRLNILKKAG
jgi:molecular chaperone DnaK (HSP70)